MFEWNDLRYFLAVARAGTLSAAARELGVAQTTVGRRLEVLEEALGSRLFDRTKGGLNLSPVGHQILALAHTMERTAGDLERRARGRDQALEGLVRITTTEAFARTNVVPRLAKLQREHPGLVFEVLAGNRQIDLDGREADLAVRLVRPEDPSLVARRIGQIELHLYSSPAYLEQHGEVSLGAGLSGHRVAGYVGEMARAPEARWLAEHASQAEVVLRSNSIPALVSAVEHGMALAILPATLAAECGLRCVLQLPQLPPRPVWLVFHADLRDNARVRCVVEALAIDETAPSTQG
ncbi:LysR family transcriptional regulator [Paraliomyxa miuraensis]|uniref:LysR family transcriptional regulator n=1 Tax=Paraliomyxa miuraensis TaxID=376150 RepID=UPI002257CE05|nr:LysR family transcriptional regulator [Paraliomyxa miuraensis]MCX4240011.1 LysR family transcriptional regulator [Paraliomyxa miuraensis]